MNLFEFADRNVWMMALYLVIIGYFLSLCFRKKYPDSPWLIGMKLLLMIIPLLKQAVNKKSETQKKEIENGKNSTK